jgi:hypothetical protein
MVRDEARVVADDLHRRPYFTCIKPTASAPAAAAKIPISTTWDNVDRIVLRMGQGLSTEYE